MCCLDTNSHVLLGLSEEVKVEEGAGGGNGEALDVLVDEVSEVELEVGVGSPGAIVVDVPVPAAHAGVVVGGGRGEAGEVDGAAGGEDVEDGDLGELGVHVVEGLDVTKGEAVAEVDHCRHLSALLSHGKGVSEHERGAQGVEGNGGNGDLQIVKLKAEEVGLKDKVDAGVEAKGGSNLDTVVVGVGKGGVHHIAAVDGVLEVDGADVGVIDESTRAEEGIGAGDGHHRVFGGGDDRGDAGEGGKEDLSHLSSNDCLFYLIYYN